MNVHRCKIITVTALLSVGLAAGAAEPTPRDLHAARCVAALDQNTRDMAEQVKAGRAELRGLLLERLIAGTAFVGDAYLHSDVDEKQAKQLAQREQEAQKNLTEAELGARQTACAAEGTKLYADGNGLQQSVVKHLARKRMNKLLGA